MHALSEAVSWSAQSVNQNVLQGESTYISRPSHDQRNLSTRMFYRVKVCKGPGRLMISAICQPECFTGWKYVNVQAVSWSAQSVNQNVLQGESTYISRPSYDQRNLSTRMFYRVKECTCPGRLMISAICQPEYFTERKYVHVQAVSRLAPSLNQNILQGESMYMWRPPDD